MFFFRLWALKDGSIAPRALGELMRTQWLPYTELKELQWTRLRRILAHAYYHCDYYRGVFDAAKVTPDIENFEQLAKIPVLTKETVRQELDRLIARPYSRKTLVEARTGGSTGTALTIYFDERCQQLRNAAEMRSDRWSGWDLGTKKAALWGNPPVVDTWKTWLRTLLLDRTFYLDTLNLNDHTLGEFVHRWERDCAEVLYGHAHSIYILAKFLELQRIDDVRPRAIISTSMALLEPERQVIERVLQCKVTNRYGCEEVGLIACECEQHRGLHLNIDHLYIEFLKDDNSPAMAGERGEIVVTDLVNLGMPMIRYKLGDIGVPTDRSCPCERGLPLMENISGRIADFLKHPDGSLVAGISLIERTLTAIEGIEQMQIVQENLDCITINLVRAPTYDQSTETALLNEMKAIFGPSVQNRVNYVQRISQDSSGKYRFSICKI